MPLSPTAMMLLSRADNVLHLDEWLVRVIFERNPFEKNSKPMVLKYGHFMPRLKKENPAETEEYLSLVHKAQEITDEVIVDIASTKINPNRTPKFLAEFKVNILNELMENNQAINITAYRDNEGYPYHTSVGKIPKQEGLQRAIATWIRNKAICIDIKPVPTPISSSA